MTETIESFRGLLARGLVKPESALVMGLDGAALALWRDVAVPLRDGTITRADVWRPVEDGPVPAVLMRTPYGKERGVPSAVLDPATAVAAGFAVVVQDVRGTGTSGGEFEPYVNEADDGYDTIAWVAEQPWCDGRVVMTGMSYVGIVQWLAAARRPPALAALTPTITTDSVAEGWSFRGGVLESGFLRTWVASSLAKPELRILDDLDAVAEGGDVTAIAPWAAPWFSEPADSAYWAERSPGAVSARPARAHHRGLVRLLPGRQPALVRRSPGPRDRLIVGPWGHEPTLTHLVGERALGSSGFSDVFGLRERALDFYRAALAGEDPPGPRVLAYLLGGRRWLELDSWPPPGARTLTLELSGARLLPRGSRRAAASPAGAGACRAACRAAASARVTSAPSPRAGTRCPGRHVSRPAGSSRRAGSRRRSTVAATGDEPRQWVGILCLEDADGALVNIADGACTAPAGATRSRSTSATSASSCLREAGSRCSSPVASPAASRRRRPQPSSAWTARRSRSRRSEPWRYPRDVTGDAAPMAANGTALPVLRTPRLVIRPLGDADEDGLPIGARRARRRRRSGAGSPGPWRPQAALADLHQPPYGERAVVLAATGELVGLVGLVPAVGPFDQLDGSPPGGPWTPEFGLYWALAPAHRGNGYATEAAAALCRALFAALHPKRLIAMTERSNTASQAVMRRLGMTMRANHHDEPEWLQVVGVLDSAPGPEV